jgi:membrane protein DedA with SNARE-associated domain
VNHYITSSGGGLLLVSLTHYVTSYGLGLLFVLVMVESGGIPLPGETALITAGVLASQGHFNVVEVIAVAAAGAIVGDNIGYWVARRWGRRLLKRWDRLDRFAERVLPPSERFFERHGDKTVFFGRFIAILRFTAAWLAGLSKMHWWKFLIWNAAGGICWATLVGLLAYYLGKAAADTISHYGYYAAGGIAVALILVFGGLHFFRGRLVKEKS